MNSFYYNLSTNLYGQSIGKILSKPYPELESIPTSQSLFLKRTEPGLSKFGPTA